MFGPEDNTTFVVVLEAQINLITTIIFNRYFYRINVVEPCSFEITEPGPGSHRNSEMSMTISDFPRMILQEDNLYFPELERCENILIRTKKPFDSLNIFEEFIRKKTQVRYNYRKYLVIVEQDEDNKVLTFGNLSKLKYIHNFLLMHCHGYVNDNDDGLEDIFLGKCTFYTFIVIENNTIQWVYLDDWYWHNQSFVHNRNLYPDRLFRLEHNLAVVEVKELHAGGIDYLPYSQIDSQMGMELKAILEYAGKYNLALHLISDEEYWGKIYENWTGPGILGGVASDKYDIGFSALFMLPSRVRYSDFSKPTAFSCVSCIVPAPRLVESWLTPVHSLHSYIWTALIITFLLIISIFRIIEHYMMRNDVSLKHIRILTMFAIFVMQSLVTTQMPKHFSLRLIYTMIFLLSLLITTAYDSKLSSLLVVPNYEGYINTVHDLAESGLLWGELAIDWVLPLKADERPIYQAAYKKFRVVDEKTLRDYSLKHNFAFGAERLITGYYAVGAYLQEDVVNHYRVMKDDLYRQYTCLQLRKNSVWLPSIDLFLMKAWESGLLYYWENQANINHTNYKVQKSLKYPQKHDNFVTTLQMFHIKGTFLCWAIGLTLSIIVFLMEISFFKYRTVSEERLKFGKNRGKNQPQIQFPHRKVYNDC